MAKRDINNIEHLQDLVKFLAPREWEMQITNCGIEIQKKNAKLCMVFYLDEVIVDCDTVSFDVYFNEFILDLNSQEDIEEVKGNLTWLELMEELKMEYTELVCMKQYVYGWAKEEI